MGYAFITSDFVGTTGYSGKPIHTMVAVSPDAKVLGVQAGQAFRTHRPDRHPRSQDEGRWPTGLCRP
jgi:hypothetical protein